MVFTGGEVVITSTTSPAGLDLEKQNRMSGVLTCSSWHSVFSRMLASDRSNSSGVRHWVRDWSLLNYTPWTPTLHTPGIQTLSMFQCILIHLRIERRIVTRTHTFHIREDQPLQFKLHMAQITVCNKFIVTRPLCIMLRPLRGGIWSIGVWFWGHMAVTVWDTSAASKLCSWWQ